MRLSQPTASYDFVLLLFTVVFLFSEQWRCYLLIYYVELKARASFQVLIKECKTSVYFSVSGS